MSKQTRPAFAGEWFRIGVGVLGLECSRPTTYSPPSPGQRRRALWCLCFIRDKGDMERRWRKSLPPVTEKHLQPSPPRLVLVIRGHIWGRERNCGDVWLSDPALGMAVRRRHNSNDFISLYHVTGGGGDIGKLVLVYPRPWQRLAAASED